MKMTDETVLGKIRRFLCCCGDDEATIPKQNNSNNTNITNTTNSKNNSNDSINKRKKETKNDSRNNSDGEKLSRQNSSSTCGDKTPTNTTKRTRKSISASDRIKVWQRIYEDKTNNTCKTTDKCKLCDTNTIVMNDGGTWEVAHITSFAEGGAESLDNLRPICRTCNRSMGKKHFKKFCQDNFPHRFDRIVLELHL
jgi:hypothetical protein